MNNIGFQQFLQQNIVEAYVSRRHEKPRWSNTRGIFATTNRALLNSIEGLRAFGFRPPQGGQTPFNPLTHNCVVAYDIFKGEFRNFSMDNGVNIINSYPVNSPQNIMKFWTYYIDNILTLSADQKLRFCGLVGV